MEEERQVCDCKSCQTSVEFVAMMERLERRDAENARLINELYAKMTQFIDGVATEVTKIEKLVVNTPTTTTTTKKIQKKQPVSTSDYTSDFLNITTSLARIENNLTTLNKKK